jgi:site-specific recombinase XerD
VTLNLLNNFSGERDLQFRDITVTFLKEFESYLRHNLSLRINSVRIYLNNIRSVYYHAIDAEMMNNDITPFRKFKIQQEKTKPKPLDVDELQSMLGIRNMVTKQI